MKSKEEILNLLRINSEGKYDSSESTKFFNKLTVELLLDIRELLREEVDNHKVARKQKRFLH